MMHFRICEKMSFLFIIISIYTGCTISFYPSSYEDNGRTDYVFPVTGNIIETNNVASVIEGLWTLKNKPLPEAHVLLRGKLKTPIWNFEPQKYLLPSVKLKNPRKSIFKKNRKV